MIFPSTNGDCAIEDDILENNEELESRLIDYSICRNPIYLVFVWSQAEKARNTMLVHSMKHNLVFLW